MPGKHRLYLHCPGLLEEQIEAHFAQFGKVTDVYLPKGLDGYRKGYGFVSFEAAETLTAALTVGEEHLIGGKSVRINRAGPRPATHVGRGPPPPQIRQQSAPNLGDPPAVGERGNSVASAPPGGLLGLTHGSSAGSQMLDNVGIEGTGPSASATVASSIPKGAGPRIYVGGIPNAVSETMVRNYFSNWGKVEDVYFPKERGTGRRRPFCFVTFTSLKAAEKAVAQSNREISGYQVASITLTEDRSSHYQQKGEAAAGSGSEEQPGALEGGQQQQAYNLPPLGMLGGVPNLGATLALQQHLALLQAGLPQGSGYQSQQPHQQMPSSEQLAALQQSLLLQGQQRQGMLQLQPGFNPAMGQMPPSGVPGQGQAQHGPQQAGSDAQRQQQQLDANILGLAQMGLLPPELMGPGGLGGLSQSIPGANPFGLGQAGHQQQQLGAISALQGAGQQPPHHHQQQQHQAGPYLGDPSAAAAVAVRLQAAHPFNPAGGDLPAGSIPLQGQQQAPGPAGLSMAGQPHQSQTAGLPLQGQQQGTGPTQHPHQHLLQQQQSPQEGFWTYDQPVSRAQHDLQALGPAASESQQ